MNEYPEQWNYLHTARKQKRHSQSLLFVGALDLPFYEFISRYSASIFCTVDANEPCRHCIDCQMVLANEHPDVEWIKPEKSGGPIKIDQIRELQSHSYLTPQRSKQRLLIIESAEKMNTAAANALLKILEEPAPHILFLLIAQHLSTVLPTVLSRCQVVRFPPPVALLAGNFLNLAQNYAQDSAQALILEQAEPIIEGLIAVLTNKEHPCVIAAQWTQFELHVLLWFLYLVFSQVQHLFIKPRALKGPAAKHLEHLSQLLNPVKIFEQIDKINKLQRKLSHNINVNHTLVLEDLLFDL